MSAEKPTSSRVQSGSQGSNKPNVTDLDGEYFILRTPASRLDGKSLHIAASTVETDAKERKMEVKQRPTTVDSKEAVRQKCAEQLFEGDGAIVMSQLLKKPRLSRGLKNANSTYRVILANGTDVAADGSGVYKGSIRFGDPSLWDGSSTWSALFQRFRVVRVEYYIMRSTLNTGAGTTPSQSCCYLDVGVNSVTPSGMQSVWAAPNARMYSDGSGYGFSSGKVKPILRAKIKPEQEWFDLSSETQKGCLVLYTMGNTASVNCQSIYAKFTVEFSGLLL